MATGLIFFGIFIYLNFTLWAYIFLTPKTDRKIIRIKYSFMVNFGDLKSKTGPEYAKPLFQITGILWIFVGIGILIFGEPAISFTGQDIFLGIVFLLPVLIGALVAEKRSKRITHKSR